MERTPRKSRRFRVPVSPDRWAYMTMKQIAAHLGVTPQCISYRIRDGDNVVELMRAKHERKEESTASKQKRRTRRTRTEREKRHGYNNA